MMLEGVATYDSADTGWDSTATTRVKRRGWTLPFISAKPSSTVSRLAEATVGSWVPDATVIPGEAATTTVLHDIRARERLSRLIKALCSDLNVFPVANPAAAVQAERTRSASLRLLAALPRGVCLPKVSPDGEGAMVFLWARKQALIVTVEGWRLHIVESAGTPDALYHDDVDFRDKKLPPYLLTAIRAD